LWNWKLLKATRLSARERAVNSPYDKMYELRLRRSESDFRGHFGSIAVEIAKKINGNGVSFQHRLKRKVISEWTSSATPRFDGGMTIRRFLLSPYFHHTAVPDLQHARVTNYPYAHIYPTHMGNRSGKSRFILARKNLR
jgi:hypothetical protein